MVQHSVCFLVSLLCVQKQCMPEANLEHPHIVHTVCAAAVHSPIVPEIDAEQHAESWL